MALRKFIGYMAAAYLSCTIILSLGCEDITVSPAPPYCSTVAPQFDIIDSLGAGFNLGNVFDFSMNTTDIKTNSGILDHYQTLDMRHVRIPITWSDGFGGDVLADNQGNIDFSHPRFQAFKDVVDYALATGYYVVINTHHEHWFKSGYDDSSAYDDFFITLWTQIANHFKGYPEQLIFEVLNEPEGAFGDWIGGLHPYSTQAQARTRHVNKIAYDAIRATGGNNTTRYVMVSPNGQGNQYMLPVIYPVADSLPGNGNDPFLMVQVHSYDPWDFCGPYGDNAAWPGKESLVEQVCVIAEHSGLLNTPVLYGEFGVGRANIQEDRNTQVVRDYYLHFRRSVTSSNMAATVWDDRGWFRMVEMDANGEWAFTYQLAPFMMWEY